MTNPDPPQTPPADSQPLRPVAGCAQGALHRSSPNLSSRAIAATCALHRGPMGFTNLLVSKRGATIVLDPHVDGSCVISLDQDAATALCDTLTEWLG